MGFLSFNEKYYITALERLEGSSLGDCELYEAKQLLKLLDDLIDEGYTLLNRTLEEKYGTVSRLRAILKTYGVQPFPIQKRADPNVEYSGAAVDVDIICRQLSERAKVCASPADDPFLTHLKNYCDWIEYRPDTAYVFLLRDAFLPYLYFKSSGKGSLFPWVINRDFLQKCAGDGVDDKLRQPIYDALESGVSDFSELAAFCKPRILNVLNEHTELKNVLLELLCGIREKKILVIESGYCGTIPLTLSALDDRVDFRLYTTAPFLYEIYREKIFCKRYEDIRSFETLCSQDALMKFSSFQNGRFYVRAAADDVVWERSAREAAALQNGNCSDMKFICPETAG